MSNHLHVSPSLFDDLMAPRASVADIVCGPCDTGAHEHCRRRSCACGCARPSYSPKAIPEPFIPHGVSLDEDGEAADPLAVACPTCGARPGAPCDLVTPPHQFHARRRLAAAGGA